MMHQARDFDGAVALLRQKGLPPTYPRLAVVRLLLQDGRDTLGLDDLLDRARDEGMPLTAEEVARVLADLQVALPASPALTSIDTEAGPAAQVLRTLGNPWRLKILCRLLQGEACVGALEASMNLSQSALSQHLARLRLCGLICARRQRQNIFYAIPDTARPMLVRTLCALGQSCVAL